jgi:hypothetical protein
VLIEEIPDEFKKICEQYGYHLVDGMFSTCSLSLYFPICCGIGNNMVVAPQPNADGTNGSPISPPAPQPPSSQSSNAISIHSSSTDWEQEYGVTPLSSDATMVPSPIFPCGCTM